MPLPRTARFLPLVLLAPYAYLRLATTHWDLLDDVDLAIHEAGHIVFRPLGDHMEAMGGSLFQVLVPLAFVIYFWRTRQRYASGLTLAWVGASLANVARYVGDARAQELPLLGGENSIHDWWYLLTEWDLLQSDVLIARVVHLGAAFTFLLAFVIAGHAAVTAWRAAPRSDPAPADRPTAPARTAPSSAARGRGWTSRP